MFRAAGTGLGVWDSPWFTAPARLCHAQPGLPWASPPPRASKIPSVLCPPFLRATQTSLPGPIFYLVFPLFLPPFLPFLSEALVGDHNSLQKHPRVRSLAWRDGAATEQHGRNKVAEPLGASSSECLHWTQPITCTIPGATSYCHSCFSRLYAPYLFRKRNPNSERLRFTQATQLVRSSVRAPIHLPVSKPPVPIC